MRKLLAPTLAAIATAASLGCSNSPSEKPTISQLVGTYRLSERSQHFLESEKGYTNVPASFLKLEGDGSVKLTRIPDVYLDGFGRGHGRYVSGSGRWEIIPTDYGYGVSFDITKGEGMRPGIYHGSSNVIRGKRPPFHIEFVIGDPDSDEWISYERASSPT